MRDCHSIAIIMRSSQFQTLEQALQQRILVIDGAMGTTIQDEALAEAGLKVEANQTDEKEDLPPILAEIETNIIPGILSQVQGVTVQFEGQTREQKKMMTSMQITWSSSTSNPFFTVSSPLTITVAKVSLSSSSRNNRFFLARLLVNMPMVLNLVFNGNFTALVRDTASLRSTLCLMMDSS